MLPIKHHRAWPACRWSAPHLHFSLPEAALKAPAFLLGGFGDLGKHTHTHTMDLSPLKQITQGLTYLSMHSVPRRIHNQFAGELESLKGERKAILGFPHPGNFPKGEALLHLHGHRSCARHGLKQGGPFRSRLCFPLISGEELELAIRSPRVPGEHDSMVSYSPPHPHPHSPF